MPTTPSGFSGSECKGKLAWGKKCSPIIAFSSEIRRPLLKWTSLSDRVREERRAMQLGKLYRLTREAMAIAQRNSRNVAITIPKDAVIEVIGGPFNGTRLMDVRYDGEMILMFTDDMETHTELVKAKTA